MSTIVDKELFDDDEYDHENEIRSRLARGGLLADQIKKTLSGEDKDIAKEKNAKEKNQDKEEDNTSLKEMLLNMPTNKTSCLVELGKYLSYSTTYSELLFKFNKVNTTRNWRFRRYAAKQRV